MKKERVKEKKINIKPSAANLVTKPSNMLKAQMNITAKMDRTTGQFLLKTMIHSVSYQISDSKVREGLGLYSAHTSDDERMKIQMLKLLETQVKNIEERHSDSIEWTFSTCAREMMGTRITTEHFYPKFRLVLGR